MSEPQDNESVTIADLNLDVRNVRHHSRRNLERIEDSLREFGPARSIVIDEANTVLAGNGVLEVAGQIGIENVRVVDADPDTIVAVRLSGLTPEEKARFAIRDNLPNEPDGERFWEGPVLLALQKDGVDLGNLWKPGELDAILQQPAPSLETSFQPNLQPESGSHTVTEEDMARMRRELAEKMRREQSLQPVVCPHCGMEFYVNAQVGRSDA